MNYVGTSKSCVNADIGTEGFLAQNLKFTMLVNFSTLDKLKINTATG